LETAYLILENKKLFNKIINDSDLISNSFDFSVAGADILFLAWTGLFYFVLVFLIESCFNKIIRFFLNL
jgi:hypothetical protein